MRRAGSTPLRRARIRSGAAALLLLLPVPSLAATLTVTVDHVRSGLGHVRIGVCEKAQFLTERCDYHAIVSARPGSVTATIPDVRPGLYAVEVYHDPTDAGRLRRGLFGIPKDDTGFSRNPPQGMGPPGFDACAVAVAARDLAVAITLHRS